MEDEGYNLNFGPEQGNVGTWGTGALYTSFISQGSFFWDATSPPPQVAQGGEGLAKNFLHVRTLWLLHFKAAIGPRS